MTFFGGRPIIGTTNYSLGAVSMKYLKQFGIILGLSLLGELLNLSLIHI